MVTPVRMLRTSGWATAVHNNNSHNINNSNNNQDNINSNNKQAHSATSMDTLLARAGCIPDPTTGSVTPAIHLATTFLRDSDGGYSKGFSYGRQGNPTRNSFETIMAQLEGGTHAAAFASGMAASNAIFQSLQPNTTVILPADLYFGVSHLLDEVYTSWGLRSVKVDMSDPENVAEAIHNCAAENQPASLVWLETPSNPCLVLSDIEAISTIAHANNVPVGVDATWMTPKICQPLKLGADIVLHSVTKYLGGHSDLMSGVIVTHSPPRHPGLPDLFPKIETVQKIGGGVASPFDSFLALRGLRSLAPRIRQHCESALKLSQFLEKQKNCEQVFYPGLPTHPQHDLAQKQMKGGLYGGMLSFTVVGGEEAAWRVKNALQLFTRATSLGGTESLVEHRRSIEAIPTSPANLLRVSVGLEDYHDLEADLAQALLAAEQR
eukprot:m.204683 g.204683  ORF g.204683 m.204683 type:complete len:436 (-) comp26036_c3_seq3:21-1328(-)